VSKSLGDYAFALKMQDESMAPELKLNDVLIIDPDKLPQPGQFVVARIAENSEVIVRRYKQLSAAQNNQQFELLAENKHWADVKDSALCNLVGAVCGFIRVLHL
jgi:SOS-response transcriptional repressor LexA